jgi:L-threonylcarbamoyladenylate synthase
MGSRENLRTAARKLLEGGLVAFPTETVYGLGALATSRKAVQGIFSAKGRPADHPLIVHSANIEEALSLARELPDGALRLARAFWPGPMTLVLPKTERIPDLVTGGQDTVGVRVPAHRMALDLLYMVGLPVAAPSANRFGKVSPTRAEHVRQDLGRRVDFILDGGPCRVGVESTILGFREGETVLLRPGGVPQESIEEVLGRRIGSGSGIKVSGSLPSHYAPRARVVTAPSGEFGDALGYLKRTAHRLIVLRGRQVQADRLYQSLREADAAGADVILAELPPEEGLGLAVGDRLRKAAGPRS